MNDTFLKNFPKQLGHWAIHGFFNALPSFIIAVGILKLSNGTSIIAMLSAVGIFVVVFATVTSWPGLRSNPNQLLPQSIRFGAKIRSWIAGISLLLLLVGKQAIVFMPDFWCGCLALGTQRAVAKRLGAPGDCLFDPSEGPTGNMDFLPVFTTTMLEGFIISFLLLMISFFCLIFLQARERRKFLRTAAGALGAPARVPDGPETLR